MSNALSNTPAVVYEAFKKVAFKFWEHDDDECELS